MFGYGKKMLIWNSKWLFLVIPSLITHLTPVTIETRVFLCHQFSAEFNNAPTTQINIEHTRLTLGSFSINYNAFLIDQCMSFILMLMEKHHRDPWCLHLPYEGRRTYSLPRSQLWRTYTRTTKTHFDFCCNEVQWYYYVVVFYTPEVYKQ